MNLKNIYIYNAAARPNFRGAQVVSRAAASSFRGQISWPCTRVGLSSGDCARLRRMCCRCGGSGVFSPAVAEREIVAASKYAFTPLVSGE